MTPPSTTTDQRWNAAAPTKVEVPRPKRGEGQWALGYREPLNANEQAKKDDDALNVRARIENIYAHRGFASIDPSDLRNRFRWWGLYTQRRPGIDGGRTAVLEPWELDDEYFMLRVRIDGGQLTTEQLRDDRRDLDRRSPATPPTSPTGRTSSCTGSGSRTCRRSGTGSRPSASAPQEACGDCPRVVLGSPLAGIAADELIDPTPAIDEITARYIGDKAFSNLPRKFKTAITGHPSLDVAPEVNDISFVPTVHPEHGVGFDVWVGGGLSTNPMLAKSLGVWVPLDEVPDVWAGVVSVFRDYGYRRLRARARLKFLVADWGVEKFREVLEQEYLAPHARRRRAAGEAARQRRPRRRPRAGRRPPLRRLLPHRRPGHRHRPDPARRRRRGARLDAGAHDAVPEAGRARRRGRTRSSRWSTTVEGLGLSATPSQWRRSTMACTGIEFCKLAIVETKDRAAQLVAELERRIPELDTPITRAPQRLPQLLRPHPGRRHRAQGPARPRRRRQPRRGLPGAPRRRRRARGRLRSQAARAQGHVRRPHRLRRGHRPHTTSPTARTASASPPGSPAQTRRCCDERPQRARCTAPTAPARTCTRTARPTAPGSAASACARSRSSSSACSPRTAPHPATQQPEVADDGDQPRRASRDCARSPAPSWSLLRPRPSSSGRSTRSAAGSA